MLYVWAAVLLTACTSPSETGDAIQTIVSLTGDVTNGAAVYDTNCAVCHGDSGEGDSGPELYETEEAVELADIVWNGSGDMAGYDGFLTEQEVADVIAFVADVFHGATPSDSTDASAR